MQVISPIWCSVDNFEVGAQQNLKAGTKNMSHLEEGQVEEIENFFGVYLLLSQNARYKGRTYVGFTVDPIRRLNQHNGGIKYNSVILPLKC